MQLHWVSPIADDRYVADRAWKRAILDECPFHPEGGCGVRGHGSYLRVHPAGARVPRFLCPVRQETISLLPSFLAAHLPSTLDEIEAVVDAVEGTPSVAAAADVVRPANAERPVTSITAARWVRRRVRPIRAALLAIVTLLPELAGCIPTLVAIRAHLGVARVLVTLRELGAAHLGALAPPLGLRARGRR